MRYKKDFLFYRIREGVEPGSVKDALIRNPHRCLDYRAVMDHRRKRHLYNRKIHDMRREARKNKNCKSNFEPLKIHNLNVIISLRDYQSPF